MNHASLVNIHVFNQVISSPLKLAVLRVAEPLHLRLKCPVVKDASWGKAQGS